MHHVLSPLSANSASSPHKDLTVESAFPYSASSFYIRGNRIAVMKQEIDYSLLPPCCNSGCTTCVLDYPELYLGNVDENMAALLEAVEKAEQQAAEIEDFEWTNNAKMS